MPFASHKEANEDLRDRIFQGIQESFPIVGKRRELHLEGLEADLHLDWLSNAGHVQGEKRSDTTWRIGFWWDGDLKIKL